MKAQLCLLILSYSVFVSSYDYSNSNKAKHNLKIEGHIYQNGMDVYCKRKVLDSVFIFIYDEKKQTTDTLMTNLLGNYDFILPLNSSFMINVSKKGFVTKKLHANTHVPIFFRGKVTLEFELDLFKEIKDVNVSILDKPVAEIAFYPNKKSFDYNRTYTDMVNRKLKNSYVLYYKKQPTPIFVKSKW